MKLMPASSAAWMIAIDSSWSGLPQAPNIIAPRQRGLTRRPVRPRLRWCTTDLRWSSRGDGRSERDRPDRPGRTILTVVISRAAFEVEPIVEALSTDGV